MGVHATSILAKNRLRHEGCVNAIIESNLLDHESIGHHDVCHREGIGVSEVDFVLTRSHFMVAVFDADAHLFEDQDCFLPEVCRHIEGRQVEIPTPIESNWRRFGILKIKVFEFRPDIEDITHLSGSVQNFFENPSRVTDIGLARGLEYITKHSGNLVLLSSPRENAKSVGIWHGHHVAFIDSSKSLY